jgi:hypothetical protein
VDVYCKVEMQASSSWFLNSPTKLELSLAASHDLFVADHAILPLLRRRGRAGHHGRSSLAKTSPACTEEHKRVTVHVHALMLPFPSHHWLPAGAMEEGKVALTAESETGEFGELGKLGGDGGHDELELGPHLYPDEARAWTSACPSRPPSSSCGARAASARRAGRGS